MLKIYNRGDRYMENKLKETLLRELRSEGDKPADEINVERIEIILKLLDTYNERPVVDDYDEFLDRFNARYGLNLKNPKKRKKEHFTIRINYKVAIAVMVLIITLIVSNAAVKASTEKSILSWVSQGYNSVVFEMKNTHYDGWTKEKTTECETSESTFGVADYNN